VSMPSSLNHAFLPQSCLPPSIMPSSLNKVFFPQ
jgi:hypothetical protein